MSASRRETPSSPMRPAAAVIELTRNSHHSSAPVRPPRPDSGRSETARSAASATTSSATDPNPEVDRAAARRTSEKVRAATPVRSQPLGSDEAPESAGFAARIDGASLPDLVQMECLRGLTHAVRVVAAEGVGVLYFDQGQVVHAETKDLLGEAAAQEILSWTAGVVEPHDAHEVRSPTITTSWQGLLMAAAHASDEMKLVATESRIVSKAAERDLDTTPYGAPPPSFSRALHEQEPDPMRPSEKPAPPGILRAVKLDAEGNIIGSVGDVLDFSDAAAYAVRLAQLIGDGLGLEPFRGLECNAKTKTMLAYLDRDSIVALEAEPNTDLSTHRKRAGT